MQISLVPGRPVSAIPDACAGARWRGRPSWLGPRAGGHGRRLRPPNGLEVNPRGQGPRRCGSAARRMPHLKRAKQAA